MEKGDQFDIEIQWNLLEQPPLATATPPPPTPLLLLQPVSHISKVQFYYIFDLSTVVTSLQQSFYAVPWVAAEDRLHCSYFLLIEDFS